MRKHRVKEVIRVEELTLAQWLALLANPPAGKLFRSCDFPTNTHKEEYITSIEQRTDDEISLILEHFLIRSDSYGVDDSYFDFVINVDESKRSALFKKQYFKRLLLHRASGGKTAPPWEGNTWIIDLLPHCPRLALDALHAYFIAHAQLLTDSRIHGIEDAAEIIRARYIELPNTDEETVHQLSLVGSRNFEHLVERLYDAMGYETELTPRQKDGGRDINAQNSQPGHRQRVLVECKLYERPVGVDVVRHTLGVVRDDKANKGTVVTNSRFTAPAQDFATRNHIELIDGSQLVRLLNKHLGAKWFQRIDALIMESVRRQQRSSAD